eukprot:COSAG04_NODE_29518_length_268_cov_0.917160_1_plen_29_part_10
MLSQSVLLADRLAGDLARLHAQLAGKPNV